MLLTARRVLGRNETNSRPSVRLDASPRRNASTGKVFDRRAKMMQRSRVAIREDVSEYEYLKEEINRRLLDRLEDVYAHQFESVLEMGSGSGETTMSILRDREDVKALIQVDPSFKMLQRGADMANDAQKGPNRWRVVGDEESLPFADKSFDVITSNLALHWVNDLPGTMTKCRELLKDDRIFIASMFGEGTLQELRNCIILAESERHGGVGPHISPFAAISDMGNLLGKAGFSLTTTDQESITVRYKDPFVLLRDIQLMGESNAIAARSLGAIRRDTLFAAASIYQQMYGDPNDGYSVPATFNVIYLCGWTPHSSQPKPKRRGSATHSFSQLGQVSSNPTSTDLPNSGNTKF